MQKKFVLLALGLLFLFLPVAAYAHEAYVLSPQQFAAGLKIFNRDPLGPLLDAANFQTSLIITVSVVAVYGLNFLWAMTGWAGVFDRWLKKIWTVGPLVIRLAISASFFFAAISDVVLGPELRLAVVPMGEVIRGLLILVSVMILLGIGTEAAAMVGMVIFGFVMVTTYGSYMITYTNYFGELLVLFLFGSRYLSLDRRIFGKKLHWPKMEKYKFLEVPIVRILYGIALIYAGWTIKFVHQNLTVTVYSQYHLARFFWGATPDFIAAGAGLSEVLIGFFIVLGFAQRLTVFISLVFITLGILYFKEMVWPHFMLYGISVSLLINSADFLTADRYLIPLLRRVINKRGEKNDR